MTAEKFRSPGRNFHLTCCQPSRCQRRARAAGAALAPSPAPSPLPLPLSVPSCLPLPLAVGCKPRSGAAASEVALPAGARDRLHGGVEAAPLSFPEAPLLAPFSPFPASGAPFCRPLPFSGEAAASLPLPLGAWTTGASAGTCPAACPKNCPANSITIDFTSLLTSPFVRPTCLEDLWGTFGPGCKASPMRIHNHLSNLKQCRSENLIPEEPPSFMTFVKSTSLPLPSASAPEARLAP
mmetsp:Transcript_74164/g.174059  ORF Transcript_74164/g.174059 Transcript_74164/m.174059 type:complete len:238 (+) Transcript_74164:722-1435(+)